MASRRGRDEERTTGRSLRMLALSLASRPRDDLREWPIGQVLQVTEEQPGELWLRDWKI